MPVNSCAVITRLRRVHMYVIIRTGDAAPGCLVSSVIEGIAAVPFYMMK